MLNKGGGQSGRRERKPTWTPPVEKKRPREKKRGKRSAGTPNREEKEQRRKKEQLSTGGSLGLTEGQEPIAVRSKKVGKKSIEQKRIRDAERKRSESFPKAAKKNRKASAGIVPNLDQERNFKYSSRKKREGCSLIGRRNNR